MDDGGEEEDDGDFDVEDGDDDFRRGSMRSLINLSFSESEFQHKNPSERRRHGI